MKTYVFPLTASDRGAADGSLPGRALAAELADRIRRRYEIHVHTPDEDGSSGEGLEPDDLRVRGTADVGEAFRLDLVVERGPGGERVAEKSFESPVDEGGDALEAAAAFVGDLAGAEKKPPPKSSTQGGFRARLDVLRGRELAERLDGWEAPDEARRCFEPYFEALQKDPEDPNARGEVADLVIRAARSGTAPLDVLEEVSTRLIAERSTSYEGHAALAAVQRASGDRTAAESSLRKALDRDPGRASLRFELGEILLEEGRAGRAAKVLETVKVDPKVGARALFHLGRIREMKDDVEGAIAFWRDSAQQDPEPDETLATLGRTLVSLGRFDEAETAFGRGLAGEDAKGLVRLGWGIYLAEQNRYRDAIAPLDEGLRLSEENADVHLHLGRCYEAEGDRVRAVHHLRRAMLIGGRAGEKARGVLSEMTTIEPEDERLDHYREAVELPLEERIFRLKAILNQEMHFVDARIRLAEALLEAGRAKAAEKQIKRVLKKVPEMPEAWRILARALSTRGKSKAAEEAQREALRRAPNAAVLHLELADILTAKGDLEGARHEVDEARTLEPHHPRIAEAVHGIADSQS